MWPGLLNSNEPPPACRPSRQQFRMQPVDPIRPDVFAARTVLSVDFSISQHSNVLKLIFLFFLGEQIVALLSLMVQTSL